MMSDEVLELVLQAISKLENEVNTKEEINQRWSEVKHIILAEMSRLPDDPLSNYKKQNRKFRKSKPFWNAELETLWSQSCAAENNYLRFKVRCREDFVKTTTQPQHNPKTT